jgi:hypothetical protein
LGLVPVLMFGSDVRMKEASTALLVVLEASRLDAVVVDC